MSITGRQWDLFLSYAHGDTANLAQRVADLLDRRGLSVFLDDVEILPGDVIVERLTDAIHNCRYFVALVSDAYVKSGWCRQEMLQMLTKEANANEVGIIPFRLGNCQVPQLLATRKYLSLAGDESESDQVTHEILKVVNRDYAGTPGVKSIVNAPVWVERMCELASLARRYTSHLLKGDSPELYAQRLEDIYYEIASIRTRYTSQVDPEYYDLFEQLQNRVFRGACFPLEERGRIERTHRKLIELTQRRYVQH